MAAQKSDRDQAKTIEAFVRKLHTRKNLNWQPEERIGKPLYDALLALFDRGELTDHQTANALIVLHRLRGWGSDEAFHAALFRTLTHPKIRARNQAAVMCLARMRFFGLALTEQLRAQLGAALELGLYKDTANQVRDVLERGEAALKPTRPGS